MPSPIKRGGKPVPKSKGSVWDRVIDVADNTDNGLKVNLFGRNGSGKTTLACSFPKPLLLLGFEDGTKSVRRVDGVKFFRVWNTEDIREISRGVVEQGFKTVVLDTATSLQDLVLKEIMNLDDIPVQLAWGTVTQKEYQARAEKTKELMRLFIDLADRNPVNVVILAQEKDHTPKKEEGTSTNSNYEDMLTPMIASSLGRSTCDWLQENVDYICQTFTRMETVVKVKTVGEGKLKKEVKRVEETGRKEFCLRMDRAHPVFGAKIRADRQTDVPSVLTWPTYERFMAALEGDPLPE